MKSVNIIEQEILQLENEITKLEDEYNNLDQISMQGSEGRNLKYGIMLRKGAVEKLKWVLSN